VQTEERGRAGWKAIAGDGTEAARRTTNWEKAEEKKRTKKRWKGEGSRKTDRCQGNEGNLHFVKLSLGSLRTRPEHGG